MVHIGSLIEKELRRQERSVTWFASNLHCDRMNVYKFFKKQSIDKRKRRFPPYTLQVCDIHDQTMRKATLYVNSNVC